MAEWGLEWLNQSKWQVFVVFIKAAKMSLARLKILKSRVAQFTIWVDCVSRDARNEATAQ